MNVPQLDEIKKFILTHFEVEKISLSLLNGRLTFVGKLKEGSTLGALGERNDLRDNLDKISIYLRSDFTKYVMLKVIPLTESRTVVELHSIEADLKFYSANGKEIPLW
jgi:hypothetical protein